jgi:hypothetical protein
LQQHLKSVAAIDRPTPLGRMQPKLHGCSGCNVLQVVCSIKVAQELSERTAKIFRKNAAKKNAYAKILKKYS